MKRLFYTCILLLGALGPLAAQVSILNGNISTFNITPRGMLEANIMNNRTEVQVVMEAKLLTAQNEVLLNVVSAPFLLKHGLNNTAESKITLASVVYATGDKAAQLKTMHSLPSGKYVYCASIKAVDVSDEYCQDLEAESSSFLFLVSPPDKEEIETRYPILIWTHSELFSGSNAGDNYRILVTGLNKGQSAEAAVNTNVPVYMKTYLSSHEVQYPIDAKELEPGKTYAWQVQKLSNGTIVNKTEAWEFKIKPPPSPKAPNYVTVKKTLDGTVYKAENNKIYFRFDQGYATMKLHYLILNDRQEAITAAAHEESEEKVKVDNVKSGYNKFIIDLNEYKIAAGTYLLEITNEKKEVYKLKFIVE